MEVPQKVKRYYVRHSTVPFEEDCLNEFKGHCNLSAEEVPPWTYIPNSDKRTRAPVSRCINAFLNSGRGGTVYLGILDSGDVKGINLTQYRQDHLSASLDDLMHRYNPPVQRHRYRIKFVPIVDASSTEEEILRIVNFDSTKTVDTKSRERNHILRTHDYCWCFKDSMARYGCGTFPADYIVEISVKPWAAEDPRNENAVGEMRAAPVHQDEMERAYFRRQASVYEYTAQELYTLSKALVREHYTAQISKLREELTRLRNTKCDSS